MKHEASRLAALAELRLLDTLPEATYDDLVSLAAQICGTPISLVSLVDRDRQWFKARIGLDVCETTRDVAFCAHAIERPGSVFIVEDAAADERFRDNPLVTGDPGIRFYAGAPIVTSDGHAVGTVCVIDTVPRALDAAQVRALQALARQATALLELRNLSVRASAERARSAELLSLVLSSAELGLWELHVPTDRFTANAREYEMLGHAADDAQPSDWRALIHPDDWPTLDAAIKRHLAGEVPAYHCEHRMRHRAGHWVWVLTHAAIVERDAAGRPLRIVGTHMDVSAQHASRVALQSARDLLQRMGRIAQVGGWELDLATQQVVWTEETYRIHELDPAVSPDLSAAISFYAPQARPTIQAAVEAAVADGTPWDLELGLTTATGRSIMVRAQGEAVVENGRVVRLFGAFQDITERHAAEQAAIDSQRRLRLLMDNLPALVAHIDNDERYRFLNGHVHRVFGTDIEGSLGRTMREVRGERAYAQLAPHVAMALRGEPASFVYADEVRGRPLHYQSNYIPDIDAAGQVQGFFAMTFDITELRETQAQLERLARVDTLTGLPNRRQFDERIAEAMARSRRSEQAMAVMFLDIDHFKDINDSLGHAGGDAVLCEIARRLKGCLRTTDLVARLAGDEFVVVLEGVGAAHELDRLAAKVVASIRPSMRVAGADLPVTVSLGVATGFGDDLSPAALLGRADDALYQAKKQGRDRFAMA